MKRFWMLLAALALLGSLAACKGSGASGETPQPHFGLGAASSGSESAPASPPASTAFLTPEESESAEDAAQSRVLVAYFSATGNTQGVARHLGEILNADLYEIVPETPYTEEDLDYSSETCRANREQNDPAARPALSGALENPENYDVIFLGYPIWWGQAPKILYTFLESCDFSGATLIPFCTSGSSGIGSSAEGLQALTPNAQWLPGERFGGGASREKVAQWVGSLELDLCAQTEEENP